VPISNINATICTFNSASHDSRLSKAVEYWVEAHKPSHQGHHRSNSLAGSSLVDVCHYSSSDYLLPLIYPRHLFINLVDMGFELTRQRFLRAINSKYIYGTIVSLFSYLILSLFSMTATGVFLRKLLTKDSRTKASFARHSFPSRDGDHWTDNSQVQRLLCRPPK
jgi:hypothetical protein